MLCLARCVASIFFVYFAPQFAHVLFAHVLFAHVFVCTCFVRVATPVGSGPAVPFRTQRPAVLCVDLVLTEPKADVHRSCIDTRTASQTQDTWIHPPPPPSTISVCFPETCQNILGHVQTLSSSSVSFLTGCQRTCDLSDVLRILQPPPSFRPPPHPPKSFSLRHEFR